MRHPGPNGNDNALIDFRLRRLWQQNAASAFLQVAERQVADGLSVSWSHPQTA